MFVPLLCLAPARSFQFLRPRLAGLATTRTRVLFPKMKQKSRHRPLSGDRRPCPTNPPLAPMTVRSPSGHSPKSSSRAHAAMQRRYRASSNDSTEDLREAIRHCSRRCSRHLHEALKRALRQALTLQRSYCSRRCSKRCSKSYNRRRSKIASAGTASVFESLLECVKRRSNDEKHAFSTEDSTAASPSGQS